MIKNFGMVSIVNIGMYSSSLNTQWPSLSNKKFLIYQIVKTNLQKGSYKL